MRKLTVAPSVQDSSHEWLVQFSLRFLCQCKSCRKQICLLPEAWQYSVVRLRLWLCLPGVGLDGSLALRMPWLNCWCSARWRCPTAVLQHRPASGELCHLDDDLQVRASSMTNDQERHLRCPPLTQGVRGQPCQDLAKVASIRPEKGILAEQSKIKHKDMTWDKPLENLFLLRKCSPSVAKPQSVLAMFCALKFSAFLATSSPMPSRKLAPGFRPIFARAQSEFARLRAENCVRLSAAHTWVPELRHFNQYASKKLFTVFSGIVW